MPEINEDELILFRVLADRALVTIPDYIIPKLADAVHKLLAEVERLSSRATRLENAIVRLTEDGGEEVLAAIDTAEDGGEPLSRRSLDAGTLLWAADELDAQAEAHGENIIDYTDHLRCFTEQSARKSIVPRPGVDVPVESAPAAEPDTERCAHCGDTIDLIDGKWKHRPGLRSPHDPEPWPTSPHAAATATVPHNRKETSQ